MRSCVRQVLFDRVDAWRLTFSSSLLCAFFFFQHHKNLSRKHIRVESIDSFSRFFDDTFFAKASENAVETIEVADRDPKVKETGAMSMKTPVASPDRAPRRAENPPALEDFPTQDQVVLQEAVSKEDAIIAEKLDAVIAKVSSMEADNALVSDAEVDSLLRIAQQEILTDKIWQQDGKVDAMALLNEVEGELDKTFRDQLFEKLKDGFFKVRTAVADRNN